MQQAQTYTENDWKLFRRRIPEWQENYMGRLIEEYMAILGRRDTNPSDRFWQLAERIEKDKKDAGVQLRMSRSRLIFNMISLLEEGAISMEDLDGFSDTLKETVSQFLER